MEKRPLHILSLLSAVVCIASLLLVGRSFVRVDGVVVPVGQANTCAVMTLDGQLWLWHTPEDFEWRYYSQSAAEQRPVLPQVWQGMTGIRWLGIGWGTLPPSRILIVPLWLLPILTAILPVRWRLIRRRDAARGFAVVPSSPKAAAGAAAEESSTNAQE